MATEKTLYIIAGCNGAGKTTASYTVLPEILQCQEFVNADEIAKGLSPFNPESVAIEAGRLMLERIGELLNREETFSIETTLSTRSYRKLIANAREKGYMVKLIFFWLDSTDTAIKRVAKRVSEGGHNIPREVIVRRYRAGIVNLFNLYMNSVDYWLLVNNTQGQSVYVAEGGRELPTCYFDEETYKNIEQYVRN